METRAKQRLTCECGKTVTPNTLRTHIRSSKCKASEEWKKWVDILSKRRKDGITPHMIIDGFPVSLANKWFVRSLFDKEFYEKLVWDTMPVMLGKNCPKNYEKLSKERVGAQNPATKARIKKALIQQPLFEKEIKEEWERSSATKEPWLPIVENIRNKYPDVMYAYADIKFESDKRGHNKNSFIQSKILGIDLDEFTKQKQIRRGTKISKGQRSSNYFIEKASKHASTLKSSLRVTKPHIKLYELFREIDPKSSIEYTVKTERGFKSFDIYSPRLNALIEMHGTNWHSKRDSQDFMSAIVNKNIENDKFKKDWAISHGFKYFVFWDNEQQKWKEKINGIISKTKD